MLKVPLAAAWALLCLAVWIPVVGPGSGPGWIAAFWVPLPVEARALFGALTRHGLAALCAGAVALAGLGLAYPVLALARFRRAPWPVAVVLGLTLLIPAAVLGLGLAGLLRLPVSAAVVIAGLAFAVSRGRRRSSSPTGAGWPGIGWLLGGAALLLPSLLGALAPQSQYDALQYHFALPRDFLSRGRVFLAEPQPLSHLPLGEEMLFALGMGIGGDRVARILNWLLLPLSLACVRLAALRLGFAGPVREAPWLLLAASPVVGVVAAQGFTDLGAMCPIAAATAVAASATGGCVASRSLVFGLLLGAAGAAKATGALLALCALVPLAPGGRRLAALAGFSVPLAPWALKNLLLSGSVFGGAVLAGAWPAFQSAETAIPLSEGARWVGAWHPSLWLWFPHFLLRDAAAAGHEVSPLLVIALPALLFGRIAPAVNALRVASALAIAVWAGAGGGQVRLLSPAFPLIVLAGAGGLRAVSPSILRPALGLAVFAGWWRLSVFLYQTASPVNVVLGAEAERAYLARVLTPHSLYMAVGSFLDERPGLGRPYVAGDIKAYGWPRVPLVDSEFTIPHLVRWARDSRGPVELRRKLRQNGIGCIVHRLEGATAMERMAGGYAWTDRSLAVLQRFMVAELVPERSFDRPAANAFYRLWAVRPPARGHPRISSLRWLELPYAETLSEKPDRALYAGRPGEAEGAYRDLAAKFPSFAIPRLRLAEAARLRGNREAMEREDRAAARLLGLGGR